MNKMKRVIMLSLIGGALAAGIICIHRFRNKNSQPVRLHFTEYALGG